MEIVPIVETIVETIGEAIDLAGVILIAVGVVITGGRYLMRFRSDSRGAYHQFRQGLGRTLLLGLEILVAADVIRTVAIRPTLSSVGALAIVVLIRTFLSWSLEVELEGRWPWQAAQTSSESADT
ncbi:MAG: DUF1622 domain-containing protein [Oscillochloris sp.]|nr:DUF1622 domain-containing protein [Oscillochloris sp.]